MHTIGSHTRIITCICPSPPNTITHTQSLRQSFYEGDVVSQSTARAVTRKISRASSSVHGGAGSQIARKSITQFDVVTVDSSVASAFFDTANTRPSAFGDAEHIHVTADVGPMSPNVPRGAGLVLVNPRTAGMNDGTGTPTSGQVMTPVAPLGGIATRYPMPTGGRPGGLPARGPGYASAPINLLSRGNGNNAPATMTMAQTPMQTISPSYVSLGPHSGSPATAPAQYGAVTNSGPLKTAVSQQGSDRKYSLNGSTVIIDPLASGGSGGRHSQTHSSNLVSGGSTIQLGGVHSSGKASRTGAGGSTYVPHRLASTTGAHGGPQTVSTVPKPYQPFSSPSHKQLGTQDGSSNTRNATLVIDNGVMKPWDQDAVKNANRRRTKSKFGADSRPGSLTGAYERDVSRRSPTPVRGLPTAPGQSIAQTNNAEFPPRSYSGDTGKMATVAAATGPQVVVTSAGSGQGPAKASKKPSFFSCCFRASAAV